MQADTPVPIQPFHLWIGTGWRKEVRVDGRESGCRCKRKRFAQKWLVTEVKYQVYKDIPISLTQTYIYNWWFKNYGFDIIGKLCSFLLCTDANRTDWILSRVHSFYLDPWGMRDCVCIYLGEICTHCLFFWSYYFCTVNRIIFCGLALICTTYRHWNVTITLLK